MESLTDREYNRAVIQQLMGYDIDAPFGQRVAQSFRRNVPGILNSLSAIGPGRTSISPTNAQISHMPSRGLALNNSVERVSRLPQIANDVNLPRPANANTQIPLEVSGSYRPSGRMTPEDFSAINSGDAGTIRGLLDSNRRLGEQRMRDFLAQERRESFQPISGGRTKGDNNPPVGTQEILDWLGRAEIPVRRINTTRDGTTYIRMNSERQGDLSPTVRVPADGHLGTPRSHEVGNLFDTGTHWSYRPPRDVRNTSDKISRNVSGGRYSDPNNLFDALRWRFSRSPDGQFLISPDQAPTGIYRTEAPSTPVRSDPNQLNLFSSDILRALTNGPQR